MAEGTAITLLEFNRRVNRLLHDQSVQQCWIVAETSDVMVRNGHCYLELVQKNPTTGQTEARARAIIWANRFVGLKYTFESATKQAFGSGLKVMVEVSANFHEQYGYSLLITDINPTYTLGDMARQRIEILNRLKREGILDMNKALEWPVVAQRIAVISAGSAAGYGDFMHQLHENQSGIKFYTCLFQAAMQGVNTAPSIIAALDRIIEHVDLFDCVVIIRGGGATSELNAFDNYDLAARIAQFPIPVVTGIGHDRDNTVIDAVSNIRVKTPTAAAEWILGQAQEALTELETLSDRVVTIATQMLGDARQQLAFFQSSIPLVAENCIIRHRALLTTYAHAIPVRAEARIAEEVKALSYIGKTVAASARQVLQKEKMRLESLAVLRESLSPDRVLKRGYSLTSAGGRIITSIADVQKGQVLLTRLADGTVTSEVK